MDIFAIINTNSNVRVRVMYFAKQILVNQWNPKKKKGFTTQLIHINHIRLGKYSNWIPLFCQSFLPCTQRTCIYFPPIFFTLSTRNYFSFDIEIQVKNQFPFVGYGSNLHYFNHWSDAERFFRVFFETFFFPSCLFCSSFFHLNF